jgi:hypothetical protein
MQNEIQNRNGVGCIGQQFRVATRIGEADKKIFKEISRVH